MASVKYFGNFLDPSGYGEANRQDIIALYIAGCNVTTEVIRQMPESTDFSWQGKLCENLINRNIEYKIKIHHVTPDVIPRYYESNKYNIARLFWETDKLPEEWIKPLNSVNEVWTSSNSMIALLRKNGIKVPMYAIGQAIDISEADKPYRPFNIPGHKGFLFYSIFQWIERKNPRTLLQSYWETFTGRSDVSLLLKTYRLNYSQREYEKIRLDIERWKREISLVHYPRIFITTKLLSHNNIMRIHKTGDCYLSTDHGEGWSRPLHEALLMGKPAISTARGGLHEYLDKNMYYPIDSTYVPVVKQNWIPYYTSDQNWAQINKEDFKDTMREVFAKSDFAKLKPHKAMPFIKTNTNYNYIGGMMRKRLEEIEKAL